MVYQIRLKPSAVRDLKKIPESDRKRVARVIDSLANNPRPREAKKLRGEKDLYRVRAGDYRVIYQVKDKILLVLVIRIRHRREVYR